MLSAFDVFHDIGFSDGVGKVDSLLFRFVVLFLEIQRRYKHLILFHSKEKLSEIYFLFFFLVNDNTDPWKARYWYIFVWFVKMLYLANSEMYETERTNTFSAFVTLENESFFEHVLGLMAHSLHSLAPPPRKHWTLLGTAPANVV